MKSYSTCLSLTGLFYLAKGKISFFSNNQVVFHCVNVPHLCFHSSDDGHLRQVLLQKARGLFRCHALEEWWTPVSKTICFPVEVHGS